VVKVLIDDEVDLIQLILFHNHYIISKFLFPNKKSIRS
jgi:hypothetical protein